MSSPRVWFITGASSGFGFLLATHALKQGDTVVATMRNPAASKLPTEYGDRLMVLQLDVTNAPTIPDAFRAAKEKFGRIDVVFNNAGYSMLCEFEGTPEDKARALFDTNFWGAVNVTKAAVKAFRENAPPGGRLLQNSSSSALTCPPGVSFYGASKAALEAITESVAQELDPEWNIKITLVESGPFNTSALSSSMQILPVSPDLPYNSPTIGANPTRNWMSSGELYKIAGDPPKAAKVFYKLGCLDGPQQPKLDRVVLHSVAVQSAKARIESISKGIEAFENEWKDTIFGQAE